MSSPERRIPWYLWCAALAVTSAYVGGYWDISWHRSIGRDSFWSAPHIAMLLLAFMNRASNRLRTRLQWLFLYVGGTTVCESLQIFVQVKRSGRIVSSAFDAHVDSSGG